MAVGSGSIVIPPTDLLEDINNIWSDSSGTSSSRCSTQEEAISGDLLPFASLLCCVHSTSSSDQRPLVSHLLKLMPLQQVTLGMMVGRKDRQRAGRHTAQELGRGCPKVLRGLGALPSLPSLALQVLSFPSLSPFWGMRNAVLLRVVSGNKGKALGRCADTSCCLIC